MLGGSTDSEFVHHAWRTNHADLKDLPFPMLADVKRELCTALGILDPQEGVAQRATFIVDPHNIIRFVSVNDLSVGRNPQEVLRVLDALQTDELCPCNWQKGEASPHGRDLMHHRATTARDPSLRPSADAAYPSNQWNSNNY